MPTSQACQITNDSPKQKASAFLSRHARCSQKPIEDQHQKRWFVRLSGLPHRPGRTATGCVRARCGCVGRQSTDAHCSHPVPTCTNIDCTANSPFTGCVYAPNATLTLRGTNSVAASVIGSFVGNRVRINGHVALHYDESLRRSGPYEVLSLLP